ncbi:DNA methyltransferase [Roseiconus lacunae]|uniref:DNA methyltransferase n=1 Tax=Roseiconus lacunae TaxID=2605694 RepID=UPI001E29B951|nr:DNA methyltransferase [Roseiconus lacunae]MCD0461417.1 hypothetical protein [Roseiconus lacunae]
MSPEEFIDRWKDSGGAELANSQSFLKELCDLLGVPQPEVLNTMRQFDDNVLPGLTIDPHQFLGIEINPRAAALAELVLWIGSIQWYKRTRDTVNIPEPILKDYGNIECRDAVLDWDSIEDVFDDDGNPVTRWDGRTTKTSLVTGEEVPDETARVQEKRYVNPRKAEWPKADYIVGNPPFIGNKRMRFALGDGYTDGLRSGYSSIPGSADYVMYWWAQGAELVAKGNARRSGLITTNSITQSFNSAVVAAALGNGVFVSFAIPDHPWVDSASCAQVRVAMTVVENGEGVGSLCAPIEDEDKARAAVTNGIGKISASLRLGADTTSCEKLQSNEQICNQGVIPIGKG